MARTYQRDANGRFAGGGSSSGRRRVRAKAGGSVTSARLQRNRASGTAKPGGTVSGTRFGRSVDQFARETAAVRGGSPGIRVKRQAPTLRQQAKAAGLGTVNPRTTSKRVLQENSYVSSAPKNTISRSQGIGITASGGPRKLVGTTGTGRTGRMSLQAAMKRERARSTQPAARVKRLRRRPSTIKR
jgi:hypothetical protein